MCNNYKDYWLVILKVTQPYAHATSQFLTICLDKLFMYT